MMGHGEHREKFTQDIDAAAVGDEPGKGRPSQIAEVLEGGRDVICR